MKTIILSFLAVFMISSFAVCEVTGKVTAVHSSGRVKEITFYNDGKEIGKEAEDEHYKKIEVPKEFPDGTIKISDKDGNLYMERSFSGGKENGIRKEYNSSGELLEETAYRNGKENGADKSYYKSGKLKEEWNYSDGKAAGVHRQYYENGQLRSEQNYVNDNKEGTGKKYYESGKLESERNYSSGKPVGTHKGYYESGKPESEENYIDGKPAGTDKEYYESGKLRSELSYKDGKPVGTGKKYYESGAVENEVPYKDGKYDGEWKYYYADGKLKAETPYKNDKREGSEKGYYPDGKLQYETQYKNGECDGYSRIYRENGTLDAEYTYKNGAKDGKQKEYFEDGKLKLESTYKDNKMDGIERRYSGEGKIESERAYNNGAYYCLFTYAYDGIYFNYVSVTDANGSSKQSEPSRDLAGDILSSKPYIDSLKYDTCLSSVYIKTPADVSSISGKVLTKLSIGAKVRVEKVEGGFIYGRIGETLRGWINIENVSFFKPEVLKPVIKVIEKKYQEPELYIKGAVFGEVKVLNVRFGDKELPRADFKVDKGNYGAVYPFEIKVAVTPGLECVIHAENGKGMISEVPVNIDEKTVDYDPAYKILKVIKKAEIRKEPDEKASSLLKVDENSTVNSVGSRKDWYYLEGGGWINRQYVKEKETGEPSGEALTVKADGGTKDRGTVVKRSAYLEDVITTALVELKKYRVSERTRIQEVMKEQKFQLTGCTESDCAVEVGRVLNAHYIVIGSISRMDADNISLSLRVVDVESSEVMSSLTEQYGSEKKLIESGPAITEKLMKNMPPEGKEKKTIAVIGIELK